MPGLMLQVLLLVAVTLFSARPAAAESLDSRTNVAAGVTVKVSPQKLGGDVSEFEVVLDTHSRELVDDLAASAVLVTGKGESTPLGWSGDPPGGHHRKGILRFKGPIPREESFQLRMHLSGEAQPRLFRWERQ